MAILFVDGFESFGSAPGAASGLGNKWVANGTHPNDTVVAGRFDGLALRPANDGSASFNATDTPIFPTSVQTNSCLCGFAFQFESMPAAATFRPIVSFESSSGTEVGVAVGETGDIRVYRSDPTTNIQTSTSTGLVIEDEWHYLEFKATIANNPTGTFDVYLDGVQVAFAANTGDTLASVATIRQVRLYGRTTSSSNSQNRYVLFDDFYCLSLAVAPNDFLGPRHVYTLFPTAAGDDEELTPSTGDNYAAVDDNGIDSDTSYVESSVDDAQDLYQFGDLPAEVLDIQAVVVYSIAKRTDVSSFDVIALAKSGGIEDEAAPFLVDSTSYIGAGGVILVDPDTTSAWTLSGVNAAQFGLKVGA